MEVRPKTVNFDDPGAYHFYSVTISAAGNDPYLMRRLTPTTPCAILTCRACAIQGFYGVTLLERHVEPTVALLDVTGLKTMAHDEACVRFAAAGEAVGRFVDLSLGRS